MSAEPNERTCAGCRETDTPEALVRLAYGGLPPTLVVDLGRKLGGRGMSVHPSPRCIAALAKGGAARSLRAPVALEAKALTDSMRAAYERRLGGLLLAGMRTRTIELGTDAVRGALASGRVQLLWLATDAEGRREDLLAAAKSLGRHALALFTKEQLGRLVGREQVAVIAVLDSGIASEISACGARVIALSEAE